ncbi:hypothetical protein C8Q70DRAFT_130608 [Cubamyces menziesii]|nr:hypothetical protein C8Q70DRAFT_130608 [Cubamyces menziesii]
MIQRTDLVAYIRSVEADQNAGLSSAAAMTFSVWDILLSFSDEIQLIWQPTNGWLRWLYAFIRYFPLIGEAALYTYFDNPVRPHEFTVYECDASTLAESILLECVTIAVETVLLMRVHALYSRSRLVLLGLLAGLAATVCATFCGMWFAMGGFIYDAECFASSSPKLMPLVWLSPVAFEAALFIMTLVKFQESRRFGLGRRPILDTIMRDGTWGFFVALLVMSLNAVVYTLHAETLSGVFYFWAVSTLSFTGSHMLLNLRRIAYEPQAPWDAALTSTDTICFKRIDLSLPTLEVDDCVD